MEIISLYQRYMHNQYHVLSVTNAFLLEVLTYLFAFSSRDVPKLLDPIVKHHRVLIERVLLVSNQKQTLVLRLSTRSLEDPFMSITVVLHAHDGQLREL